MPPSVAAIPNTGSSTKNVGSPVAFNYFHRGRHSDENDLTWLESEQFYGRPTPVVSNLFQKKIDLYFPMAGSSTISRYKRA